MRLLELSLTKIGPFNEAKLSFLANADDPRCVAVLTGQNGTGKSIVIDAIRALFGAFACDLERDISRPGFRIEAVVRGDSVPTEPVVLTRQKSPKSFETPMAMLPHEVSTGARPAPGWVIDFWRSSRATDTYEIESLVRHDARNYLVSALQGTSRNAATTEWLAHFDYLRDSRDSNEKRTGEAVFEAMTRIINESLHDGHFLHIERTTFTPIVHQSGFDVPLARVSSGNAYLIHRMIGLLAKMYSLHLLTKSDPAKLCDAPGLLLIDEAENHLHPRWQKRLIPTILNVFPNLQIIAATHSPFIVASVANARVFTCIYRKEKGACVIREERQDFASKPVDEILLSETFDETQPYGPKITTLIEERKEAIERGDEKGLREAEKKLIDENRENFRFLEVDRLLGNKSK
jgi:predicted ATP-binding protein involved in virulence